MKAIVLTALMAISIGSLSLHAANSGTSEFKEYIENEKDHIFSVVAETPNATMLHWYARGFFGMGYSGREQIFEDACTKVGGSITDKIKGDGFTMKCSAPDDQGFTAKRVGSSEYGDLYYLVQHDSPQAMGYAMKGYIKINELDRKKLADILNAGGASRDFFDLYGYCLSNKGIYVLNNRETLNKPVNAEAYLEGRINRVVFSLFSTGKQWCILPDQPEKALFAVETIYDRSGSVLKQVSGSDVPDLNSVETYQAMATRIKLQLEAWKNEAQAQAEEEKQMKMQFEMSKKPSVVENGVAYKVFKTKDSVLSRQGNNILKNRRIGVRYLFLTKIC